MVPRLGFKGLAENTQLSGPYTASNSSVRKAGQANLSIEAEEATRLLTLKRLNGQSVSIFLIVLAISREAACL